MAKKTLHQFQLEDFLADKSFSEYCLGNNPASVEKWETVAKQYPDIAERMSQARALYYLMNGNHRDTQFRRHREAFNEAFQSLKHTGSLPAAASRRSRLWIISTAAAILVLVAVTVLLYRGPEDGKTEDPAITYQTDSQGMRFILLPDSSEVWLNQNSQLTVHPGYNQGSRAVELVGEAFFDVRPDQHSKFSVHTQGLVTQVLGTSFNINAVDGKPEISVAVKSGKVRVSSKERKSFRPMTLTEHQRLVFHRATESVRIDSADVRSEQWLYADNNLVFKRTPLSEVADRLAQIYGTTVTVDPSLAAITVYYTFSRQSLEKNIKELSALIGCRYTSNGNAYQLLPASGR